MGTYERIRDIIEKARFNVVRAVNNEMVTAYWHIGREIVEAEQSGKSRADYGRKLLADLSRKLTKEYGQGFDTSNLWNMRKFYLTFPILDALRRELSWTHYRILIRIEKPAARSFYEIECVKNNWSSRELERQKGSLLFERLALSKDKKGLLKLARRGQEIQTYPDLIKDPYVLEFTGLSPQAPMTIPRSGLSFARTKRRPLSDIPCLRAISRSSPQDTSCICPAPKSWPKP